MSFGDTLLADPLNILRSSKPKRNAISRLTRGI
uniref:Uncharacterized protein LOC8279875 n=1 Tax=Rhizophora mucronata TaxID=61149 RepID=A0A2P2INE1_RHIMU